MSDNQEEEEEQENSFEHIRWLLWHPSANGILFAGSGDGSIWMWLVILNEANCLNVQQFKVFFQNYSIETRYLGLGNSFSYNEVFL